MYNYKLNSCYEIFIRLCTFENRWGKHFLMFSHPVGFVQTQHRAYSHSWLNFNVNVEIHRGLNRKKKFRVRDVQKLIQMCVQLVISERCIFWNGKQLSEPCKHNCLLKPHEDDLNSVRFMIRFCIWLFIRVSFSINVDFNQTTSVWYWKLMESGYECGEMPIKRISKKALSEVQKLT